MTENITRKPELKASETVIIEYPEPPSLACASGWGKSRKAGTALLDRVSITYFWGRELWERNEPPRWRSRVTAVGRRHRKDGTPGASVELDLFALDRRALGGGGSGPDTRSELGAFVDALVDEHRPSWTPPNLDEVIGS